MYDPTIEQTEYIVVEIGSKLNGCALFIGLMIFGRNPTDAQTY
jgi:hypothetical protein